MKFKNDGVAIFKCYIHLFGEKIFAIFKFYIHLVGENTFELI